MIILLKKSTIYLQNKLCQYYTLYLNFFTFCVNLIQKFEWTIRDTWSMLSLIQIFHCRCSNNSWLDYLRHSNLTFCGALNSKGKVTYLFIVHHWGRFRVTRPAGICRLRANRRHLSATRICESEFAGTVMVPFSDRWGRYAFASRGKVNANSLVDLISVAVVASQSEIGPIDFLTSGRFMIYCFIGSQKTFGVL